VLVYVCLYVYMCAYIHMNVYIRMHINIQLYIQVCIYIHMYKHIHIYTYIYTNMYIYIYMYFTISVTTAVSIFITTITVSDHFSDILQMVDEFVSVKAAIVVLFFEFFVIVIRVFITDDFQQFIIQFVIRFQAYSTDIHTIYDDTAGLHLNHT
jgi:hypothetical protein